MPSGLGGSLEWTGAPNAPDRAARSLLWRLLAANSAAACLVIAYLELTHDPHGGVSRQQDIAGAVCALAVTLALVALVGRSRLRRRLRSTLSWASASRQPTDEERERLLALPRSIAITALTYWLGLGLVAGVAFLVAERGPSRLAVTAATAILLGALTTCCLTFLLVEHAMRPVFGQALANAMPTRREGMPLRPRLLLSWALGSGIPLVGIGLTPLARSPSARIPLEVPIIFLVVVGILVGVTTMISSAGNIAQPLETLSVALERVENGDIAVSVPVDRGGEIGVLEGGFNRMVEGLREREVVKDLFGRHVGEEVARRAVIEGGASLGGDLRDVSVAFIDLVGFTALTERRSPSEVVQLVNEFFGLIVDAADAEGGWVNKFEGDGALCVFGAPTEHEDHPIRALRAARALNTALSRFVKSESLGGFRIGVSSGSAVVGNVGTERRYEFTVMGATVNEAARLSDKAEQVLGSGSLASASVVSRSGLEAGHWRDAGHVELKGLRAPVHVFTPV